MLRRPQSAQPGPGQGFPQAPGSWQASYAWMAQMGWSADDRAVRQPNGQLCWTVTGTDGDRAIEVTAPTRVQAWLLAQCQVRPPIRPGAVHTTPLSLN